MTQLFSLLRTIYIHHSLGPHLSLSIAIKHFTYMFTVAYFWGCGASCLHFIYSTTGGSTGSLSFRNSGVCFGKSW